MLWLLWRRSLAASLVAPPARAARTVAAGRLGWFGRMPTGPVGAGWARSLTYWLHDPPRAAVRLRRAALGPRRQDRLQLLAPGLPHVQGAAARVSRMLTDPAFDAVETVCVHNDTADAPALARAVRGAFRDGGIAPLETA
ncbi:hypothetical protein RYJ27_01975 [Microbacterium limosum]|uniref:Uncharacterized protein n=1 Tax=Microbacterium limosum TaxID=3079935 RepID=A0AAU0MJU8_9MICO|nr:hypothetical protein [Microbacterium sp. Y20]WOQ70022.1 hypothetical protein RYJ27_01975 [Microbacterium sp. Y20]